MKISSNLIIGWTLDLCKKQLNIPVVFSYIALHCSCGLTRDFSKKAQGSFCRWPQKEMSKCP